MPNEIKAVIAIAALWLLISTVFERTEQVNYPSAGAVTLTPYEQAYDDGMWDQMFADQDAAWLNGSDDPYRYE